MAMVVKTSNFLKIKASYITISLLLYSCITPNTLLASEWTFVPSLGLTETYTNNINLTNTDKVSSLVSQFIVGADANYTSKKLQFSFSGTETFAGYSHDSEKNNAYLALNTNASYSLWQDNLKVIASSSVSNINRNATENSLADLITGDTIQQIDNAVGLTFNSGNSNYILGTSLIYNNVQTEDDIGESHGFSATINSVNGSAARNVFWDVNGNFINQKNEGYTSENYQFETKIGAITDYKINPFLRIYNERVTGTLQGSNPEAIPSWGPGIRFQASKHFIIDLSYNYIIGENQTSDDYTAINIDWQPSERTSLKAGYSTRFFGDSYELDFTHRTRRLTNTVSYHETINAFERTNYQEIDNDLWCPTNAASINDCLPPGQVPDNTNGFESIPITTSVLEQSNQFTLNKIWLWQTKLALSRTTFTFAASYNQTESLSTNIVDIYADARLTMTRRLSSRSNMTVFVDYTQNIFDKYIPGGPYQDDRYKTISATYDKSLASSLNTFFTLQYLDRESNIARYDYTEARASINLTKDF
ncbi:TIGR03016 family PEP-CTERM system-associated outer membrane protein [Colwellia sp. E2M01]|uniref:TIGR03016 family PEP-CTERM system-associated outer membrane protein n=1 Tax=Colwellia sp. E2M01 TaxID=2841561 RepID=UPI0020900CC9|nr:TIGR03016 family PEP-CTERM system-associated outer membrane protein [Colwellia sp. E2M01]